jgi:hypothetical protein
MILLNFYLHILIHYFFTVLFDIFYHCFYLQDSLTSRHQQEAFIEALNDADQRQMAGAWPAWPEDGATQQDSPEEPEVVAT